MMKFLLLFLFVAFSADAQTPEHMTLINNDDTQTVYCYENNISKCEELGYTATGLTQAEACPYGGIACPFDGSRWSCTVWKCSDFNLYDLQNRPKNAVCNNLVNVKNIQCYSCECSSNYINVPGCSRVTNMLSGTLSCEQMGYTQSVVDCVDYVTCPSDSHKVHCLDELCAEDPVTGCLPKVDLPDHAIGVFEQLTCSCDTSKKRRVAVSWNTCETGYQKSADGKSCVEISCPSEEFDTNDKTNCYTLASVAGTDYASGDGWVVSQASHTGLKQCYSCSCNPSECHYNINNESATEEYKEPCCDGRHYKKCERKCPTGIDVLPDHAVGVEASCTACGTTTTYIEKWYCDESEGYVLNETKTGCDIKPCPETQNGVYYSTDYASVNDCLDIYDGADWSFSTSDYKSGGLVCKKCTCPHPSDDPVYKWTLASGSRDYMVLTDLGCNGKYKTCNLSQKAIDDHLVLGLNNLDVHARDYDTFKICDNVYTRLGSCQDGYHVSDANNATKGKKCLADDCDGYPLSIQPVGINGAEVRYDMCLSGTDEKYKLTACLDDPLNNKDYEILYDAGGDAIRCCDMTCETGYTLNKTCQAGETPDTKFNDCGKPCTKCTAQ